MQTITPLDKQLSDLAYALSDNFCYSCYHIVKATSCSKCGTDDFMRHLDGVGVEYGTEWIVAHLIEQHCQPLNGEEMFEALLDDCYPEVQIGCMTFTPSEIVKQLDPIAFSVGISDQFDDEDQYYELNGEHYDICAIEAMIATLS